VGCRVWAEWGLYEHGHDKVSVPPKTGGTISSTRQEFSTIDQLLYTVNWDTGQRSVHYSNTLSSIGSARSLVEFQDWIVAEAVRGEIVLGPMGGLRSAKIFLRNGDWISGMYGLEARLEVANIPIQTERLPRKQRVPRESRSI
jgi:hypothetical protein